jgi:hypothetical protein
MAGKKKDSKPEPYVENEDHVPNPMYQRGNVDTTGTTGDAGSSIDNITPVFAEARRDALGAAVEAIEDPNADEDRVVALPPEELSRLPRTEVDLEARPERQRQQVAGRPAERRTPRGRGAPRFPARWPGRGTKRWSTDLIRGAD